jgi:hypothetical protein
MRGQELYAQYAQLQWDLNKSLLDGWHRLSEGDRGVWNGLAAIIATQTENECRIAVAKAHP